MVAVADLHHPTNLMPYLAACIRERIRCLQDTSHWLGVPIANIYGVRCLSDFFSGLRNH